MFDVLKSLLRRTVLGGLATLVLPALVLAQEIPGPPQSKPIAIVGATAHVMHGPSIENATVLFDQGKIVAVGTDVKVPPQSERIDATGKHVYPAMFDAYTDLGIKEIGSVQATLDRRELGTLNPNVRSQVAINPDSALIPVARANGILVAVSAPAGGLVSGKSSVIQLDGWTWESMTLKADAALHVNWPSLGGDTGRRRGRSASTTPPSGNPLAALEKAFRDARAYQAARTADENAPMDLRWEAMIPVIAGATPIMVAADDVRQIRSAVAFAARNKLRLIILGGYDAPICADLLKEYNVPVIVAGVYRLPRRRSDGFDDAYTLPERLRRAGVRFCIASSGSSDAANVRNLPYHAATAAAYGLPRDEAIKAITTYPAQILGVAERVGTLEKGKDATLFVCDGDPLETPTHVIRAFIQGRRVNLSSRHTRLWNKYQEKYRQLKDD